MSSLSVVHVATKIEGPRRVPAAAATTFLHTRAIALPARGAFAIGLHERRDQGFHTGHKQLPLPSHCHVLNRGHVQLRQTFHDQALLAGFDRPHQEFCDPNNIPYFDLGLSFDPSTHGLHLHFYRSHKIYGVRRSGRALFFSHDTSNHHCTCFLPKVRPIIVCCTPSTMRLEKS